MTKFEKMLNALELQADQISEQVRYLRHLIESGKANEDADEKTIYTLANYPDHLKIEVIKTLRQFSGMGLKEAKQASESLPLNLNNIHASETDVANVVKALEDLGAGIVRTKSS